MSIQKYEKLVRSKIPAIIKADGQIPVWRMITHVPTMLRYLLDKKLYEEISELKKAKKEKDILFEAADVVQVIYDYVEKRGVSSEKIERIRRARLKDRGSFDGTYLESIEIPDGQQ